MLALLLMVSAVAHAQDPRAPLVDRLTEVHNLTPEQAAAVSKILGGSNLMGDGLPGITVHVMTTAQCTERRKAAGAVDRDPTFEAICKRPYMAPLYDPASQKPTDATACIDQYEFPDIPCDYPWVWVKAAEAAQLCSAMGKRLCDAHEWEGGCEGRLTAPDYRFDLARGQSESPAVRAMRSAHNAVHGKAKTHAYGGADYRSGVCAAASFKSERCDGGDPKRCGSNTYPTGAFPDCVSPLGVYDQHGNAAEHMNLPLAPDQMSSQGSQKLGVTEMKGSWFIFDTYKAHEDWCRWRAPYWHGTPVMSSHSHANYHLGFRCCADVPQ